MACHLGIVVLVRKLCLRVGVTPWTATILAGTLAVFGSGWENIVFAIQLVYNLSLLAFLVHLILIDHDGPPDRRDAFGRRCRSRGRGLVGFRAVLHRGDLAVHRLASTLEGSSDRHHSYGAGLGMVVAVLGQDPAGGSSRSLTQMPPYVNRGLDSRVPGHDHHGFTGRDLAHRHACRLALAPPRCCGARPDVLTRSHGDR